MKCPVCRAPYRSTAPPSFTCRRCSADLTPLIQLHDRAIHHYRQAIALLQSANYAAAQQQVQQAIAFSHANADFHALDGQLQALTGQWEGAIAAWKRASQLDPKHPLANHCLSTLQQLAQS